MPIRVSIVEDDEILRGSFAESLKDDPELVLAGSHGFGEGFLDAVSDERPDLVIMDINLPGISGIDTVRRCKVLAPAIQFLMCTVQDDDANLFEALCAGATGYLVKDAAPEDVVAALKDLHRGGSPMSPGIARRVIRSFQQQPVQSPDLALLTEREKQVLEQLAQGHRYKEIAIAMNLSIDTVRTHIRNLYNKLQVSSRTDALNKLYPR